MKKAGAFGVFASGLALSSALVLTARADALLLSDSFTANNTDVSTFNNTLGSDQAGSVATVSYSLAGYDAGWQIQHGNGGEMLLAAGWSGYARDLYASLNRNFAPDANAADKPLKIQFFLKVIDASDPSNWATFAVGSAQNAFVVAGANKFSSLFRRNGGTQQFASGGDISTGASFNPAGSTITLILSDTAGTGSPFDGGGSVARFYIDGALAGTITLAQLSSSDGYLSFEANGAFGVYDNLSVTLLNSIAWNTPAAITADANVSTNGTLLYAYTQSGAGATVNGVPFAAGNSTTSLGGGNVTLAGFDAVDTSSYIGSNPVGLSSAYQTVVQGGAYNGGSAATVTLNNLVSGHTYLVQYWVCDYRQWPPAVINRSETLTSVATSGALTYLQTDGGGYNVGAGSGSYVTGTFTADSTSQTITVTPNASAQINAIQVRELMSFNGVQASETTSHLISATDWADYVGGSGTFNSANDWGRLYWRGSAGDGQYMHFNLTSLAGRTNVAPAFVTLQNANPTWGGGVDGSFVATANGAWTAGGGQGIPGATAVGSAVNASGSYGNGSSVSWGIGSTPLQTLVDNPSGNHGIAVIGGSGSQLHFTGPIYPYLTVKTGKLSPSPVAGVITVSGGTAWNAANYAFNAGDSYSAAASLRIWGAVAGGTSGGGHVTVNGGNVLVYQPGGSANYYWAVDSTRVNAGGTITINGHSHIHNLTLAGGELGGSAVDGTYGGWTVDDPILVTGGTNSTISARQVNLDHGLITVDAGSTLNFSGTIRSGSLTKGGGGAMTLSGVNTHDSGTTVNQGSLELAGASSGYAVIRGALTVNTGATVTLTGGDGTGLGWQNGYKVTSLTLNEGTVTAPGVSHVWNLSGGVNMKGGALRGNNGVSDPNGPQLEWNWADVTVSAAATNMSEIGGRIRIREDGGYAGITFTVGDGSAVTDLLVSAAITEASGGRSITKNGAGTLVLSGTNSYTGVTAVNGGTLLVNGTLASVAVTVSGGSLGGHGTLAGAVTANATGTFIPGSDGAAGTLTVNNNLTLVSGATFGLDVSTAHGSGNDQAVVSGTLTLNNTAFNLRALSGAANLDTSADYVLATAGAISGSPNAVINWVGTPPANAANFSIQKVGNTIVLHFTAATPPDITSVTVSPATLTRGQNAVVTAAVTVGGNPLSSVTVSGSALAASPVTLYSDGAGNYTNQVAIGAGTSLGSHTLTVTAEDSQLLVDASNIVVTVAAAQQIWNGGGGDNRWSTGANWVSGLQPGTGDYVAFAGSTQTTPDMDASYNIASLTFNSGASSFTITNAANTLTVTGGITNRSTNVQTVDVPVSVSAALPIDAAVGDLAFSRTISGGGGLTKAGSGRVTLNAANNFTGNTTVNGGVLAIAPGASIYNGGYNGTAVLTVNSGGVLELNRWGYGPGGENMSLGGLDYNPAHFVINGGTVRCTGGAAAAPTDLYESQFGPGFTIGALGATLDAAKLNDTWTVKYDSRGYGPITSSAGGTLTLTGVGHGIFDKELGGGGGLVMNGSATWTLNRLNTYSGGTTVNQGTLRLDGGGGGLCRIRDALTVNSGATVEFVNDDGTGLGFSWNKISTLTLNGGTVAAAGALHVWNLTGGINLSGGALRSNNGVSDPSGPQLEWNWADVTVSAAATNTSEIGGRIRIRDDGGYAGITFTVGNGSAVTDLLVSAAITEASAGRSITKNGAGTMVLSGTNSYTGATTVNGGTLSLTTRSLGNSAAVVIGAGATLNLNFTGSDIVGSLEINGSGPLPGGTYNSSHPTYGSYFTGTGSLLVPGGSGDADGTWVGLADGDWVESENWLADIIASGTNRTASFTAAADVTVSLSASRTIGNLVFDTSDYVLAGGSTLTLDAAGVPNISVGTGRIAYISAPLAGSDGARKSGGGTLVLMGVKSYTGGTTVDGGTLDLNGASGGWGLISGAITVNTGATLSLTGGDGTGFGWNNTISSLTINGGTVSAGSAHLGFGSYAAVALNNGATITGSWQWNGDSLLGVSSAGNSQNTISGIVNLRSDAGAGHTFTVANGTAAVDLLMDATISDQWPEVNWVPAGMLVKGGSGTMKVAGTNTYGGVTLFSGGVLEVGTLANYGVACSLGNRTSGDDAGGDVGLLFRGGTLRYAGADAQSTDRGIRLSTTGGGGTIDASGSTPSATLSFTASASPNFFENPGDRTLTLTGSNTGANQFGMVIGQAGGATSLNKTGPGRWVLTGVNTFSGATTISAGTLALSGSGSIGSSLTLSLAAGATVDVSAVTGGFTLQAVQTLTGSGTVAGNATAAAGSLIVPGGGSYGTLTFTGDLALQAQSFTFDLSATPGGSNDRINIAGALSSSGNSVITLNYVDGQLGPGTYTLMTYGSHPSGTFSLNRPYSNVTLVDTGTALTLVVSATSYLGNLNLVWAGDDSANVWDVAGALTWTVSGPDRVAFGNDDSVRFTGTGSTSPAISVSGTVQPASIAVTGNKTYTLAGSGQVGGSGGLTNNAAGGGLIFANAAGYSGNTVISAGTLTFKSDYASPSFSIASGAVLELQVAAGEQFYTPDTVLAGNGTLRKTGAGTARWGSAAATFNLGAGSLIDVQAGQLVGGSHANENWTACLANLTVAAGAVFHGVEANVRVNALSGDGTISSGYPGAGYSAFTFGMNNGGSIFGGVLADGNSAGHFIKAGSGTQTLTGPSTYTGSTTLNGGTLAVTGGGALYTTLGYGNATVSVNAGATLEVDEWGALGSLGQLGYSKGNLQINGGTIRFSGASNTHGLDNGPGFTVGASGATLEAAAAGQTWFINHDSRADFYIERSGGSLTLAGAGHGQVDKVIPGSGSLVKTGAGTWTLAATNTLTGGITVSAGTLAFANTAAIALSPSVYLAAGGTCDVSAAAGFSLLAGQTLSGHGAVKGDLATVNGAAIVPGTAGTAGTLRFLDALTLQGQTNHYDLSGNPAESNDQIVVGGTVTLSDNTFVHLNYLEGLLGEGVYTVMTFAAKAGPGSFQLDGLAYNNVTLDDSSPTQLLVVVGAGGAQLGAANLVWLGDDATNLWNTAGARNWKVTGLQRFAFHEGDAVTFDGTGSHTPAIEVVGDVRPASLLVTGAQTYVLVGSGRLTGTNALTVHATGGLTLGVDADYTGPTLVAAGTLTLSNTANFASAISIAATGTLQVGGDSSWSLTSAGLVNSGLLRKVGAGSVFFSTGGSYGLVEVVDGTLRPTSNGVAVALSTLAVHAPATHDLYGANLGVNQLTGTGTVVNTGAGAAVVTVGAAGGSGTFHGTLGGGAGGAIALVKSGAGTLTLSGTSTYGGGTTIGGGTLALASAGALGSSGAISFGGGTLEFSAANTADYSARFGAGAGQPFRLNTAGQNVTLATGLAGTGATLTKLGLGTLTLGGVNSYDGSTVISSGTLRLGAAGSLATPSISIAAGAVFDVSPVSGFTSAAAVGGSGSIAGDVEAAAGFTLYPGNAATAGTLSVVGSLTLNSATTCRYELAAAKDIGSGVNDLMVIQGDLVAGGAHVVVTNLSSGAPLTAGDYVLFTYTGTLIGTFDATVTCPYPAALDYSVAGQVRLHVSCEAGGAAPAIATAPRATFTVNSLSSFTLTATDPGCVAPTLSASPLPDGVNFTTSTSGDGATRNGTFTWTPSSGQQGTYPVRVVASDGILTRATNILLYVRSVGEATNASGVPLSQTNWHVSITNLAVPAVGNATLVWASANGLTYDVYVSTNSLGQQAMSWTRVATEVLASGTQQSASVSAGVQKYFQVVPAGLAPSAANLWAVIEPALASGFNLFAAPLAGSDLRFNGAFGTNLAAVLTGHNGGTGDQVGDEVFILNADATYSNLYLDASGVWRTSGGEAATHRLLPGQGLVILRNGGATVRPRFSGPVGNTLSKTNTIAVGNANLVTFSEGKHLTPAAAFSSLVSGLPEGSYDENEADQLIFVEPDGSFRPVMRLPDGTWLDLTTFQSAGYLFTPGRAAFYIRQPAGGAMGVRF